MKLTIVAEFHGNFRALDAVLDHAHKWGTARTRKDPGWQSEQFQLTP